MAQRDSHARARLADHAPQETARVLRSHDRGSGARRPKLTPLFIWDANSYILNARAVMIMRWRTGTATAKRSGAREPATRRSLRPNGKRLPALGALPASARTALLAVAGAWSGDPWLLHARAPGAGDRRDRRRAGDKPLHDPPLRDQDRKSTRLNSSHLGISYAVFCLK